MIIVICKYIPLALDGDDLPVLHLPIRIRQQTIHTYVLVGNINHHSYLKVVDYYMTEATSQVIHNGVVPPRVIRALANQWLSDS